MYQNTSYNYAYTYVNFYEYDIFKELLGIYTTNHCMQAGRFNIAAKMSSIGTLPAHVYYYFIPYCTRGKFLHSYTYEYHYSTIG